MKSKYLNNFSILIGIVPTLVGTQKWKPDKEDLEKELRKLGIAKEDVKLSNLEDELLLDPSNPVENVSDPIILLSSNFKL